MQQPTTTASRKRVRQTDRETEKRRQRDSNIVKGRDR